MIKPMKLTDVGSSDAEVEPYLVDRDWVMQQKHDGARMAVLYTHDHVMTFVNGSGGLMSFSAALLQLPALELELRHKLRTLGVLEAIFDGELIIETGVYHVFDLLTLRWDTTNFTTASGREGGGQAVFGDESWKWRDAVLRGPLGGIEGDLVKLAVTARTEGEKRALWASLNGANVEGAVSKHVGSTYVNGARSKNWVKHKLVKTADVVVTSVSREYRDPAKPEKITHGTAELAIPIDPTTDPEPYVSSANGVRRSEAYYLTLNEAKRAVLRYAPRNLLPIGNASLIGKEKTIVEGSVVEIRFLYWTGSACVQPAIVRQRFDKSAAECDLTQFPAYTRTVVKLGTSEPPPVTLGTDARLVGLSLVPEGQGTGTITSIESTEGVTFDGPRTGRGPSGKLRNFDAMGDAKFQAEAAKVEAENNDPEALEAVRASRASRAGVAL